MIVKCSRDNTTFEGIIEAYETRDALLHYIECPTCRRRYFKQKPDGSYATLEQEGKFVSDRDLVIVEK